MAVAAFFLLTISTISQVAAAAPQALVYRGPAACNGCPESLAHLLRTAPSQFNVTYVGPKDVALNSETLRNADLYAQPGGGGISRTWPHMKPHYDEVRDFVANGGIYIGTCLGAYFAGTPGFQLLPHGYNAKEEVLQPGAEVKNRSNTMTQVNWHFGSGKLTGTMEKNRWLFFQDGAVVSIPKNIPNATILATYSSNGDLAALVTGFGKGRIGIVGPHPEATKDWYTPYHLHNPDGIHLKYGWDLVETTWHGPTFGGAAVPAKSSGQPKSHRSQSSKPSAAPAFTTHLGGVLTLWCSLMIIGWATFM